jgi:hypothetical protein
VGPTQHRLMALADELGVERKPVYAQGKRVLSTGGKLTTYTGCDSALFATRENRVILTCWHTG